MTINTLPAPPRHIDPRHVFLTAKEVILRYAWAEQPGREASRSGEARVPGPEARG